MKVIKVTDETHLRLKELATGSIGSYVEELLNKREPDTPPPDLISAGADSRRLKRIEDLLEQLVNSSTMAAGTPLSELKFDDMEEPGWKKFRDLAERSLPRERSEALAMCQDPEERDRIEKEYDALIQMYWNRYHESKPQEGGSDER